jgi:hypothetical protein
MSPIDLAIGFLVGMAAGVLFRGALNDAFGAVADAIAPQNGSAELRNSATTPSAPEVPANEDPAPTSERAPSGHQVDPTDPIADDEDRDRIVLETPRGRLTALHEGADTWLVEFKGAVSADVVHLLVADLVGPFMGDGREGRKSKGGVA